ncbi:hypothetical protein PPL_02864 [Heterostelium album PN500]|uniref:NADAR domain-containing protein n=1 Tax=Heterostelium pallidum (strain ATCC 26659 / Pp 5 / PN500) TaxID=670386 RepID=D3B398_HETP5|nr:hypothetical protein PPL_02864 [Heterostelium album PN500]EFA83796.1 hypothetical protein PPL_02864 [Heterostelium album PN500]|eukprot:XP_020435913.1 hypothetical protein PPL_02864 [Heterostelium album PN500]
MVRPTIYFYRAADAYGCFSNFSDHPVMMDGYIWPTSEHYYQAMKFKTTDIEYYHQIRDAESPARSFKMGNTYAHDKRRDWNQIKDQVMYDVVLNKFLQNKDIQRNTGISKIVEHTRCDDYWGDGSDGNGRNQLGKTLELVREFIKNANEKELQDNV